MMLVGGVTAHQGWTAWTGTCSFGEEIVSPRELIDNLWTRPIQGASLSSDGECTLTRRDEADSCPGLIPQRGAD
jgi:hypothetical protein